MIFRVYPEHIAGLWSQIEPLLERALERTSTHNAEDVRKSLLGGYSQLWCQMSGDTVEAFTTTEFVSYPRGVYVRVCWAGARSDCKMQIKRFVELTCDWCHQHDCIGIEASGRHGWLRFVPGATVEGQVMRCVLPSDG